MNFKWWQNKVEYTQGKFFSTDDHKIRYIFQLLPISCYIISISSCEICTLCGVFLLLNCRSIVFTNLPHTRMATLPPSFELCHQKIAELHTDERLTNSEWFVNSYTMVVYENFFLVQSEFFVQRTNYKKTTSF